MVESLESRTLLSGGPVRVQRIDGDNRGMARVIFDKTVDAKTITAQSVQVFLCGADKTVGTADDVLVKSTAILNRYKKLLTIKVNIPNDVTYRVKLNANLIKDTDGLRLDGEYNKGVSSGDGQQGGNFDVRLRKDAGNNPIVRFTTDLGDMDVRMFRGFTTTNAATPKAVARFLSFVNAGTYDNDIIHRSVPGFVIQWGGIAVNPDTGGLIFPTDPPANSGPPAEAGNHNVAGTISFALGGAPTTAGLEFFFNVADNSTTLDGTATGGGPFTPFGKTVDSASFKILQQINALHRLNLDQAIGGNGSSVDNVPVKPNIAVSGESSQQGGTATSTTVINPKTDFVLVSRVTVLHTVAPITQVS